MAQTVFKRYEIKYILTQAQKKALQSALIPYMQPDKHGPSTIRNIYFDTPNYRLIRHCIEKPVYKEKLRLRCYQLADRQTPIFVELKKKFDGVVYKRRLVLPESQAMTWVNTGIHPGIDSQISREIDYFIHFYETLKPAVFLSYHREAFYSKTDPQFRITFDDDILFRQQDLTLTADTGGIPILSEGLVLMEIKTSGAIPLWLTDFLTANKLYKTSFSKYGTAYTTVIHAQKKGDVPHVGNTI